jgi:midasin
VGRENGEEDAVDMTQDFGGDVADLPEEDEESERQDWEDLDKEMGELGVDNPEQIDRNMWVPEEEQDETEPQQSEEQQEGSAESDEAKIVAQEGQPKPCRSERGQEPQPAGEDNENDKDEDTLVAQGSDQEEHNHEIEDGDPGFDLDNMDQDEMEREEKMSSGEEQVGNISDTEDSVDDIEEDGSQYSQENEPNTMEELNNEPQTSEVAATQSLESSGQTGAETVTSDENLPPNSSQQEQQESTEVGNNKSKEDKSYDDKAANGASTSLVTSSTSQQEPKEQKLRSRLHHRPLEDYSLAGQEERLAKRPRLVLERTEGKHTPHERMESDTVQHLRDEGAMEHDAVVWDAAPLMQPPGTIPPTDLGDPTDQNDDSQADNTEQTRQPQFSDNTVDTGLLCPPQDPDTVVQEEQMETEVEKEESSLSHAQATMPEPRSFFVNTSLLLGQQGRVLVCIVKLP